MSFELRALAVVCAASLWAASSRAHADAANGTDAASRREPVEYRETIERALRELSLVHLPEAHALFERAHALLPNARTLRGMALVELELRDYVACVRHFEQAMRHPVKPLDAALRAETRELMDQASSYLARLELSVSPRNAAVAIDGQDWTASAPVLLTAGPHEIAARAEGYEQARRNLHLRAGDRMALALALTPSSPPGPSDESSPWFQSAWFWAGAGAVVVGAAVLTTALLLGGTEARATPGPSGTSGVTLEGI